ncbi:MAG TPA: sensor histidine kinase [Sphingomonadaceae bacterium]|nr:sensor histidine kinase [Sphingomonadaceae bacterium]
MATDTSEWGVARPAANAAAAVRAGDPPSLKGLRGQPFFQDKNRAFWVLQSVGWTGFFMLRTLNGIATAQGATFIIHTLLLTATGYSLTLLMATAYRRLIRQKALITWPATVVIVLLAAAMFSAIETWSHATFVKPGAMPVGLEFFSAILLDFAILAAWSALYYSINYYLLLEEQADRMVLLEHQASAAQLAMLRYQLNPHFLFNTLNSISTLVLLKQTERANAMLSRLASFLRYTLVNEQAAQVTLSQEVETLKLYLEIEKMRFEERMRPSFNVDPAAMHARVPSLLLQPLVENAIKYAVTPQEGGADIAVDARRVGNRVRITVSDTGPGTRGPQVGGSPSTGVGLANIRDRLSQAYGADHHIEANDTEGGFAVTIEIPYDVGV